MNQQAYISAAGKNEIFSSYEARNAIKFALDLLHFERLHLEATEPGAYSRISRLEAAWSELSGFERYVDEYYVG